MWSGMTRHEYVDEIAREIHDIETEWSYERCWRAAVVRVERMRKPD